MIGAHFGGWQLYSCLACWQLAQYPKDTCGFHRSSVIRISTLTSFPDYSMRVKALAHR